MDLRFDASSPPFPFCLKGCSNNDNYNGQALARIRAINWPCHGTSLNLQGYCRKGNKFSIVDWKRSVVCVVLVGKLFPFSEFWHSLRRDSKQPLYDFRYIKYLLIIKKSTASYLYFSLNLFIRRKEYDEKKLICKLLYVYTITRNYSILSVHLLRHLNFKHFKYSNFHDIQKM